MSSAFLENEMPSSSLFPDYQRKGSLFSVLYPTRAELPCVPDNVPGSEDAET